MENYKKDEKCRYRLLIVEDDEDLLQLYREFFVSREYHVTCVTNGKDAMREITSATYDCMVLDVDLPDGNGYDVCTTARVVTTLPIIFVSVYTEVEQRIKGLSIGGDDYMCKPCSFFELEARIILRIQSRAKEHPAQVFTFDKLVIDTGLREVRYGDIAVDFSRIEFDILVFFARNPNRVFSYELLYDSIWREPLNLGRHAVQARICDVRRKLYDLCPEKEYIKTIRRHGYCFEP